MAGSAAAMTEHMLSESILGDAGAAPGQAAAA